MRFEHLRTNRFDEAKKSFCLMCGSELTDKSPNIYARRFCSEQCRAQYISPREE